MIRDFALEIGADKCGIAAIDRFGEAPSGSHPTDIFPHAKSVVVVLRRLPVAAMETHHSIPYTHMSYQLYAAMDRISMDICCFIQNHGGKSVTVPSDVPYLYWDAEAMHGKGILSLKHAAVQAGLGVMGRNTIFINGELGNMSVIGALITDCELESDPLETQLHCPPDCRRCLDACGAGAIQGPSVNQKLCRTHSIATVGRDWGVYSCWDCRKACPYRFGSQSKANA